MNRAKPFHKDFYQLFALACLGLSTGGSIFYLLTSGPFWRDEIATLSFNQATNLREVIALMPYNTLPALLPMLVKILGSFIQQGEILKQLAFLFGISPFIFLGAGMIRSDPRSAALTSLFMAVLWQDLRWLSSFRGYGLGCLSMLLFLFCLQCARRGKYWSPLLVASSIFSALTSFQNWPILLALLCVYWLSAGKESAKQKNSLLLALGVLSLVVLLHLPILESSKKVFRTMQFPEIGLWEVFVRWYSVYWSSNPYGTSIAVMMVFSGLLLALVAKGRIWISSEAGILKPLLATILGLGFSFVFLAESKVVLYEWQFIIPMVFVGFQSSLLLKTVLRESFLEKVLMVGALLLSWLPIERPLNYLGQRTTNLDLISRYLERNYKDSDLIIINPWEPAISFAYYYKGAGEFITIPPVSKTDTHRADEIQGAMAQPVKTLFQTIEPRIAKALKNDGRVYLIGDFSPPLHGADPLVLETAPNPLWGWKGGAYYQMWSEQLAAVLISKAASADLLTPEINANEKISRYENIQVIRFNAK